MDNSCRQPGPQNPLSRARSRQTGAVSGRGLAAAQGRRQEGWVQLLCTLHGVHLFRSRYGHSGAHDLSNFGLCTFTQGNCMSFKNHVCVSLPLSVVMVSLPLSVVMVYQTFRCTSTALLPFEFRPVHVCTKPRSLCQYATREWRHAHPQTALQILVST